MKRSIIFIVLLLTLFFSNNTPKEASSHYGWAVIDAETGRLLDGHNENVKLPIASLTKIWTAFTVIESGAPHGEVNISASASMAEGSSIYLKQDTTIDMDILLHGLMLRSGNDAAYALAEHAGGSMQGFVNMMNEKALIYGLQDTSFTNPSGLHNENHLSTAYETGLMMYHAMNNEKFKKIASARKYAYQYGDTKNVWKNKHRLLHYEPTAIAGKTGFTKIAGRTLVTYFEKDGKKIIVVTLNDSDDWNTHKYLSEKTFSNYKVETVAKKGTYNLLPEVEGELATPIRLLLKKGEKEKIKHIVQIPRGKNEESTGVWTVYLGNQLLSSSPILIRQ